MRLSKISLYGFKSFARRTEFEFGEGITGIVGPNGCGKSNLVDALRWVLGEQRPTLLRASSMPDLLYRGQHAHVDHVEVDLTFDNADGLLPLDEPEVRVTRRLNREGEGEYLINQRPARLKDVRGLLLDTGLGVDGYSFMGQGRIDAILNSSAQERRMLVEEAAGTSRYRVRRKEALRKLERTEQDLARAADMVAELERQVRSLKQQAGRARNYVEKRARLVQVMGVAYARKHRELQAALAELLSSKTVLLEQEAELRRRGVESEALLEGREHEEAALTTALANVRTEVVEKKARCEHLNVRLQDLETRSAQARQEQESGQVRGQQVAEQLAELTGRREEAGRVLETVRGEQESRRSQRQALAARGGDLREREQAHQRDLDALQDRLLDVVEDGQRLRNELTDIESESRALLGSRRKLVARSAELSGAIAQLAGRHHRQLAELQEVQAQRVSLEAELSADDAELSRHYAERQQLGRQLEQLAAKVAADRSRLQVLEEAIARHEGVHEHVRGLLERARRGEPGLERIEGIVADFVTAPVATAQAVEAALGPWAEALVVPDRDAAIEVLRVVRREGLDRVRILSRAELLQAGGAQPCRLLDGASVASGNEALLEALLGKFDVLPQDVPMDLCSPRRGRALVNSEGELMLSAFETVSKGKRHHLGLITRRTECERLASVVKLAEGRTEGVRSSQAALHARIAEREKDREERAARLDQLIACDAEQSQVLRGLRDRLALLREELVLDHREVADLDFRRQSLAGNRVRLEAERSALEARREELQKRRTELQEELGAAGKSIRQAEQALAEADLDLARFQERLDAAVQACTELEARVRERQEERQHIERRREESRRQEDAAREAHAHVQVELATLGEELELAGRQVQERTAALEEFRRATTTLRGELQGLRQEEDVVRRSLQKAELREQEHRIGLRTLSERAVEDLERDPETLCRLLDGEEEPPPAVPAVEHVASGADTNGTAHPAAEANGTAAASLFDATVFSAGNAETLSALMDEDLGVLEREVGELKAALQRLGPVNLEAIHELGEVEGRATFLQQQCADLTEGRRQLRRMIEDIDRECVERFNRTFESVREYFRQLFRRLFRGGRADLVLKEAEDPSDAGIDVVAAPPGKDPRSIQALSGGERTLTATAILFALFSTRPSPFCVLDEVDAALDEANIERFTSLVKDFMDRTQFLIVTHSKRTMAVADTLYGVTMADNGISQPIAMRFEETQAVAQGAGE